MPEFRFDPPLTLKGNIVVRNLDDAVRFIISYREAYRPELRTSVLHRLEGAAGEAEERHGGFCQELRKMDEIDQNEQCD